MNAQYSYQVVKSLEYINLSFSFIKVDVESLSKATPPNNFKDKNSILSEIESAQSVVSNLLCLVSGLEDEQPSKPIETESELIDISLNIGSIAIKNSQFTQGFARWLSKIGTPIDQLTISELINQHDLYNTAFNAIYGDKS